MAAMGTASTSPCAVTTLARARVVERIEEMGRALDPADLPGGGVVHGDLHPGNMLQIEGRLSAVVDLDYARSR